MDGRIVLVLFSLNYSMSSVCQMPKIQMAVKTAKRDSLLDSFIIKKDLVTMTFYLEKSGE